METLFPAKKKKKGLSHPQENTIRKKGSLQKRIPQKSGERSSKNVTSVAVDLYPKKF